MADATNPPAEPRVPTWKRYALIGVPLVLVAAVVIFVFWNEIQIRGWINRLSSSDSRVRKEQIDALQGHDDTELVNRLLLEAVEDDGKTFDVRTVCANLLLQRQRLPLLEQAFATGSVETRGLVVRAFANERWFDKFVEDQGGRVEETVRNWLKDGSDTTRSHAIQLAVQLDMADTKDIIRSVLTEPRAPNIHPEVLRNLLIAAAGAAERFEDCEVLPRVAELARSHVHSLVRLRCMQIVDRAVFRTSPPAVCPDAVSPADMTALVERAIGDEDHRVRMGAMLILRRNPEWGPDVQAPLEAILDGGYTPAERRQALETLVALGDPAFLERFPRYFHDPMNELRSSAARVAPTTTGAPLTGCLVGLVQEEVQNETLWVDAANALRQAAGSWVAISRAERLRATQDPAAWRKKLQTLFSRGEIEGLTRDQFAAAWFRWWAGQLELTPEQIDSAVAARAAFYEAKGRGDRAAAEKALDDAGVDVPGLFSYERAWLGS